MSVLLYPIIIPLVAGVLCLIIPAKLKGFKEILAIATGLLTLGYAVLLFLGKPWIWAYQGFILLSLDNLSAFILLAIGLFGILITLYSLKFMAEKSRLNEYYAYILWTLGASCGAVLSDNLLFLLVFWGFLGLTLYLLIGLGKDAENAAKKTFVIVGASDCLLIFGIGIIWALTGSLEMSKISLPLVDGLTATAFLCLLVAAFAKAGAMPFHSWIPDAAEKGPAPVVAFLPASLDKLLGIYFLGRITLNIFIMNQAMGLLLLIVGAVTIIAAVMMALVQHDLKRLLGYHAVSQVGYMVLGIGTGNPIGIVGGLFHMLNHAIYKSGLFLCGGAVEEKAGTTELDRLGGLAKAMPLTFITCLIFAFSISGIPPFNGFASKWMVYQGVIELGKQGDKLWIIWLVAAMFGSALTLASFMKLIHCTFLGIKSKELEGKPIKEVSPLMWLPMTILASLCLIFGIFAYQIPLKLFILPLMPPISMLGNWAPTLATSLIIVGLLLGAFIYWLGNLKSLREDTPYVGGNAIFTEEKVSGTDFYNTVQEIGILKMIYKKAEEKWFDIYDQGSRLVFALSDLMKMHHSGMLHTYLSWCFLGLLILLVLIVR